MPITQAPARVAGAFLFDPECSYGGTNIEGQFRPPITGPVSERISRAEDHTQGLRKFRFEITAGVNIEAGPDAMPRFRVEIEEVKKAELEGIAGLLAKLLGKFFDDMVTQLADGARRC